MAASAVHHSGRLDGRVVLITGGARGIGFACARSCGTAGATVVVASLGDTELADARDRLASEGIPALCVEMDVRDFNSVERAVDGSVEKFGRLDAVVANAGIAEQSLVTSGDPGRWRNVIETNLIGAAHTIRAVTPRLIASGGGDIVLMASVSGRESYAGEPAYIASKWGVVGFGHAARRELERYGIRVCLVEPGLVNTPLTRSSPMVRRLLDSGPSLRPEDIAASVLWILSQPKHVSISEVVVRPVGRGDVAFGVEQ
jgi:NADP-dependent 3-hydroxy acid dehydrogenase YdfG